MLFFGACMAGLNAGGGPLREPPSGYYQDANYNVTYYQDNGVSPPATITWRAVWRWNGVDILDTGYGGSGNLATTQTIGSYTYSASSAGIGTFGIAREPV